MRKITAKEFKKATDRNPELDDLDRCNCPKAGERGHTGCGWCRHDRPVFECEVCFPERIAAAYGGSK